MAEMSSARQLSQGLRQELEAYLPGVPEEALLRHLVVVVQALARVLEALVLEEWGDG